MTEVSDHVMGNSITPYLGKYGLTREPFSQEAHDEFFLLDPKRSQLLNMLYHLAQNSELLLVVTGPQGSGKTSLLQHFIEMGDESWRSCVIDANAMMNPEQMLIQIAEGFGLPQDTVNFGSGIEMLKKRLIDMKRSELVSMLIIDDAHELPAASLTMLMKLSELSDAHEGLLRIVLFSEPQLVEILNASALRDVRYRVTHTLEMPVLNEQETAHYIQHRLVIAGLKDKTIFSSRQLKKIYLMSGGIPGKINHYAHELLLGAKPASNSSTTTFSTPARLRSLMTVLLILVITGGITWVFTRDAFNKLTEHLQAPVEKNGPAVTKAIDLPVAPDKSASLTKAPVPEPEPAPVKKSVTTDADNSASKPVNIFALRQPEIETKPIEAISPAPPAAVESKTLTRPVIEETKTPVASSAITTAPVTPLSKPVETAPVKTSPVVTIKKPVVKKPVVTDWLSKQNKNYYTLQIMGSHEHKAVAKVLRDYKLGDKAAIIKTRHKGATWYILVYGAYPGPQKAKSYIPTLPRKLTSQATPWPRKIGEIKQVK